MTTCVVRRYRRLLTWLRALGVLGALVAIAAAVVSVYWPPAARAGIVAVLVIATTSSLVTVRLEILRNQVIDAQRDPLGFGRRREDQVSGSEQL